MSDQMTDGRRFRILTVIDNCTRECLALVADTSLSGGRVARARRHHRPARAAGHHRQRQRHKEYTSNAILGWADDTGVGWHYIAPASRSRTATTRASTAGCATSCWAETLFRSLPRARAVLENWRRDYNEQRPHFKLGWMTPRTTPAPYPESLATALRSLELRADGASFPPPPRLNQPRTLGHGWMGCRESVGRVGTAHPPPAISSRPAMTASASRAARQSHPNRPGRSRET